MYPVTDTSPKYKGYVPTPGITLVLNDILSEETLAEVIEQMPSVLKDSGEGRQDWGWSLFVAVYRVGPSTLALRCFKGRPPAKGILELVAMLFELKLKQRSYRVEMRRTVQ